jgi:ribosome assembly protein SQT1
VSVLALSRAALFLRHAHDYPLTYSALHEAEKSIFSLSLHPLYPNPPLALSGGEDDLGFIFSPLPSTSASPFNSESFPPVRLTGHTDSVVATGWSFDGEMAATGGMDGKIRVWRRVKGKKVDEAMGGEEDPEVVVDLLDQYGYRG